MACVFDVANTFINIGTNAPEPITNMKLQKLLYYAQGWYLAMTNKELFAEDFEKWTWGPVCPEIYQEFKCYGANTINQPSMTGKIIQTGIEFDFINAIWNMYGSMSAIELSLKSHQEDPWQSTPKFEIIDKQLIKKYFKSQLPSVLGDK